MSEEKTLTIGELLNELGKYADSDKVIVADDGGMVRVTYVEWDEEYNAVVIGIGTWFTKGE